MTNKLKSLPLGILKTLKFSKEKRLLVFIISCLLYKYKISLLLFPSKYTLPSFYNSSKAGSENKSSELFLNNDFIKQANLVTLISKRLLGVDNCLLRCLTLLKLSQKYKSDIILKIGVRKIISSKLEAHAWLEDISGNVIFEDIVDEPSFKELKKRSFSH